MKNLHTPGPWKLEYDYSLVMPFKRGNYIVTSGPIGPSEADRDELRANARLIAAAPELLEALNTIQVCLTSWNEHGRYTNLIEYALTAIQKATTNV